jgi:hypothetical protein
MEPAPGAPTEEKALIEMNESKIQATPESPIAKKPCRPISATQKPLTNKLDSKTAVLSQIIINPSGPL